jgi:hypothetical protein
VNVIPGCELNATWPRNYDDIFFGQDNCLYDSNSKSIDGQCCTANTTTSVANPYFKQSTPNKAGTNIVILSILHIDLSRTQLMIYAACQCRVYKYQRKPAMRTSNIQYAHIRVPLQYYLFFIIIYANIILQILQIRARPTARLLFMPSSMAKIQQM